MNGCESDVARGHVEGCDGNFALLRDEAKQQCDSVPVAVNRMRAGAPDTRQMVHKVTAENRAKQAGGRWFLQRERPFFPQGGTMSGPYNLPKRLLAAARIGSMKCR